MEPEKLIELLFGGLIAFVALNAVLTLVLNLTYAKGIWKQLFLYWVSVLFVFFLQALPTTELQIIYFVTASYLPLTLLARIPYLQLSIPFPLRPCLLAFAASYPAIYFLYEAGFGFTIAASAMSVACSVPLVFGISALIRNWRETSVPQKFLLLPLGAFIIHNFNFAFFRMEPEAQLWGWAVSFAIYQTLGVLLPAIVIDKLKRTENSRLFALVEERTTALREALNEVKAEAQTNRDLIKVVLHDISNPLTSLLGRLYILKSHNLIKDEGATHLENAFLAGDVLRSIVVDVRQTQGQKLKKKLQPQSIEKLISGLMNLKKVYGPMLEEKKQSLKITNDVCPEHLFLSEEGDALINTVFSNLLSNAIKFSFNNSEISVHLYSEEGNLIVDFQDYGVGIKESVVKSVNAGGDPDSSSGTSGEKGTGFGLLLAKNFIERNKGEFLINPKNALEGTLFRIKLKSHLSAPSLPFSGPSSRPSSTVFEPPLN